MDFFWQLPKIKGRRYNLPEELKRFYPDWRGPMRKIIFPFLLVLLTAAAPPRMSQDGRTTMGPWHRYGYVFMRGVTNIVTSPVEFIRTVPAEIEIHKYIWPVTYPFRAATHFFVRATSGVNDGLLLAPVSLFTDDISPMTEGFNLPEYPWQKI